jgi:uncharacterized membrane protein (UPF0127 family)
VAAVATAFALTVFNGQPRAPHDATLHAGGKRYDLRVAATAQAQEKGLGDIASMPKNSGMLFWFTDDQTRCFWMKDMRFSLDIIWLDASRRITHIEPALSPKTYPNAFCPAEPARYVIELNSGEAAGAGLRNGETLTF